MDPSNVNNGGKWQAWQQIGYDVDSEVGRQSAASDVVTQIQSQLGSTPAEALPATKWGDRFQVNVPISGPSGDGTLVTVWQVENGVPRMITNFLKVWK
ncbi:adhesin [Mycobacterium goodii]|nr:adhesin [Mycolicibacterium goodii]